jgi:hypothetical protein
VKFFQYGSHARQSIPFFKSMSISIASPAFNGNAPTQ